MEQSKGSWHPLVTWLPAASTRDSHLASSPFSPSALLPVACESTGSTSWRVFAHTSGLIARDPHTILQPICPTTFIIKGVVVILIERAIQKQSKSFLLWNILSEWGFKKTNYKRFVDRSPDRMISLIISEIVMWKVFGCVRMKTKTTKTCGVKYMILKMWFISYT